MWPFLCLHQRHLNSRWSSAHLFQTLMSSLQRQPEKRSMAFQKFQSSVQGSWRIAGRRRQKYLFLPALSCCHCCRRIFPKRSLTSQGYLFRQKYLLAAAVVEGSSPRKGIHHLHREQLSLQRRTLMLTGTLLLLHQTKKWKRKNQTGLQRGRHCLIDSRRTSWMLSRIHCHQRFHLHWTDFQRHCTTQPWMRRHRRWMKYSKCSPCCKSFSGPLSCLGSG